MDRVGIGILGFGTVGAGVVEGLQCNGDLVAARAGMAPEIRMIADLDLESDRGVQVDPELLTTDADHVLESPDVRVIVELIGGTGVAREVILKALRAGKPVVTANKALLAEHGSEIFSVAEETGTRIYFGASVCGGVPVIRAVRHGLVGNRISSIRGILNGTCNYILTKMEQEALSFETALANAQESGFAEADPGLDIDGHDTAHKIVVLAALAHGLVIPFDKVYIEGIRGISEVDIAYARENGYRIKLLAEAMREEGKVEIHVQPTLVPHAHPLASVSDVFNAVMVGSDFAGDTLYYGKGAGRRPTASTVISDIVDAAYAVSCGCPASPVLGASTGDWSLKPAAEIISRYYLRLSLEDEPGALARVAAELGKRGISIASVLQKECSAGSFTPVVIMTHEAPAGEMDSALAEIDRSDVVDCASVRFRILD